MIDDRLPCIKARLCFSQCQSPTVFWVALLEKAYAKLVTCGALLRFDLLRSNILSYLVSSVNKLNLETCFLFNPGFTVHMNSCGLDRCLKLWWM